MQKADQTIRVIEAGGKVECACFLSENGQLQESFDRIKDLVAVVIVLERSGFQNRHYLQIVRACINRTLKKDDFRIYFIPYDMQPEDLKVYAGKHMKQTDGSSMEYDVYSIADSIIDSIHIPEFFIEAVGAGEFTPQGLQTNILNYLGRIGEIRLLSFYKNIKRKVINILGILSVIIQSLSIAFLVLLYLNKTVVPNLFESYLGRISPDEVFVSVTAGIFSVPTVIIPSLFILKPSQWSRNRRKWTSLLLILVVPSVLLLLKSAPSIQGINYLTAVLGGFVLDFLRRQRTAKRNDTFAFEDFGVIYKNGKSSLGYSSKWHELLLPWFCSMLNPDRTRAFISYTHSSQASFNTAKALHTILADIGVYCFLDCNDIERGINWRRRLNATFSNINVFIGIEDEKSIEKIWPAYELEKALRKNSKMASMDIVILAQPELIDAFSKNKYPSMDNVIPVFVDLFKGNIRDSNGSINIIPLKEKSFNIIAANFVAYRKTFLSVIPPTLSVFISGLLNIIPSSIGTLSPLLSIAAVIALFTDISTHWIQAININLLILLVIMGSYLSGFSTNLALITRFEVSKDANTNGGFGKSLGPLVFAAFVLTIFTLRLVNLAVLPYLFIAATTHIIGYFSARCFVGFADNGLKDLLRK